MMASFLIFIPILIIVLAILLVAGLRTNYSNKGDEDVIKNVYIYVVLFATLMMTIGGSVGVFMALADIISPAPHYQSFEEYKRWGIPESPKGTEIQLSEEELRANYEAMIAADRVRAVERAKNTLIKSIGWIIIPLPVFIYFQRRLNRNGNAA